MEKWKKIERFILRCFWILVIGSVFGFFAEMLYALVYTRTLEIRQGLIYGPFIQVYGAGALAYYLVLRKETDPKRAFIKGMILGGVLEYVFSFCQEILFGSVSWEYSNMFLNLNGRTSLQYCIYWGIIGVFFLKAVYPWLVKIDKHLDNKRAYIISYILMIFIIFDVSISCMATSRQNQRQNNIPATTTIDKFLDNKYPDEFLDKIYHNKQKIEKQTKE